MKQNKSLTKIVSTANQLSVLSWWCKAAFLQFWTTTPYYVASAPLKWSTSHQASVQNEYYSLYWKVSFIITYSITLFPSHITVRTPNYSNDVVQNVIINIKSSKHIFELSIDFCKGWSRFMIPMSICNKLTNWTAICK